VKQNKARRIHRDVPRSSSRSRSRRVPLRDDNLQINGGEEKLGFQFRARGISAVPGDRRRKPANAIQLAVDANERESAACRVASRRGRVSIPLRSHQRRMSRLSLTFSPRNRSHALRCNRHALIMQMSLGWRAVVNERLARAFGLHRAEKRFSAERDARVSHPLPPLPPLVDGRDSAACPRFFLPFA